MVESMIERVAKALQRANYESGRGLAPPWPDDRFEREQWYFRAREAIEAMRDPTQAMFLEAEKHGVSFATQQRVWPAMIDAALSPSARDPR